MMNLKSVIPFTKDLDFSTKISEITSISLERDFEVLEGVIEGNLYVTGEYKSHEISANVLPFSYKIPFTIEIPENLEEKSISLEICDFAYDIPEEEKINVKIELDRYTFASDGTATPQGTNAITSNSSSSYTHSELETSTKGNTIAKSITNFKNSVAQNEGYYIGRYEARKTNAIVTTKSSSSVYTWITQPQAANLSRNMYVNKPFESDLINSYSWDTTVLFIQECGNNSTYSRKTSVNSTFVRTGTNNLETSDIECNVYDMASNVMEWTTETSSESGRPCTRRGGSYNNTSYYTSIRYTNAASGSISYIAFRPLLFL